VTAAGRAGSRRRPRPPSRPRSTPRAPARPGRGQRSAGAASRSPSAHARRARRRARRRDQRLRHSARVGVTRARAARDRAARRATDLLGPGLPAGRAAPRFSIAPVEPSLALVRVELDPERDHARLLVRSRRASLRIPITLNELVGRELLEPALVDWLRGDRLRGAARVRCVACACAGGGVHDEGRADRRVERQQSRRRTARGRVTSRRWRAPRDGVARALAVGRAGQS
jgi:hypothetical protein